MSRNVARRIAAAFMLLAAGVAQSSTVTIDFSHSPSPDPGRHFNTGNFVESGLLFSVQCHYDFNGWFEFGGAACDQIYNPDYFGPGTHGDGSGRVFVRPSDGSAFSLLDIHDFRPNWVLISSNGGFFNSGIGGIGLGDFPIHSFTGPQWENVSWLIFSAGIQADYGFSSITVSGASLPEPGTVILVAGALGACFSARRRVAQS